MNEWNQFGWNESWRDASVAIANPDEHPARVTEMHRGLCRLISPYGHVSADLHGFAQPITVGDFVHVRPFPGDIKRRILTQLIPRVSLLARQSAGKRTHQQLLAANIDWVLIVTSMNDEFKLNRLERYLALVWNSGAEPVVVLTKSDCADESVDWTSQAQSVAGSAPVLALSAVSGEGMNRLRAYTTSGKTLAVIGSSGVGKSTLINALSHCNQVKTGAIRSSDQRGKHTTTARQMFLLPSGATIIDTPGLREIGLWDEGPGIEAVFEDLATLAQDCRFADCQHITEPGCAVIRAVEEGRYDPRRLDHAHRLAREQTVLASRVNGLKRQQQKKKDRSLSKLIRRVQKQKRGTS